MECIHLLYAIVANCIVSLNVTFHTNINKIGGVKFEKLDLMLYNRAACLISKSFSLDNF